MTPSRPQYANRPKPLHKTPPGPNRRIADRAHLAAIHTAVQFTLLQHLYARIEATTDERRGNGEKVHTSGVVSPTETQALRNTEVDEHRAFTAIHENDWCKTTDLFDAHLKTEIEWCWTMLGEKAPTRVLARCGAEKASTYEGYNLAWVEHSRDPLNGWNDPLCADLTDSPTGLCPRCLPRMNRWRTRNNLPTIGVQQGAAA